MGMRAVSIRSQSGLRIRALRFVKPVLLRKLWRAPLPLRQVAVGRLLNLKILHLIWANVLAAVRVDLQIGLLQFAQLIGIESKPIRAQGRVMTLKKTRLAFRDIVRFQDGKELNAEFASPLGKGCFNQRPRLIGRLYPISIAVDIANDADIGGRLQQRGQACVVSRWNTSQICAVPPCRMTPS